MDLVAGLGGQMGDNGRRRVVSEMDDQMVAPLVNYFAALEMDWVSEVIRKLNPTNDVMGVTTVTVSSASDALRRWQKLTPQARHMTAVLVTGIANGSFMQMPQDFMPSSAADIEWVAARMSELNDEQRTHLEHNAIALVVAAGGVMESFASGLEEDDDEPVH
jgi:hypothetical protein